MNFDIGNYKDCHTVFSVHTKSNCNKFNDNITVDVGENEQERELEKWKILLIRLNRVGGMYRRNYHLPHLVARSRYQAGKSLSMCLCR